MHKGIFVTATDTEVGKTYVSCQILESLKSLI
jgi:dethiobiotin synthetase